MYKVRMAGFFLCFYFTCFFAHSQMSEIWGDRGNGTYRNPVLPADYSDLDAIRVGNDYYAISSTMQFSPGMVVLHSNDLVNWEIIGHVVNDLTRISPELNWNKMNSYGKGIWAGSIRYFKNKFWVYFGTPDDGFFMSSATHAAGPWEPVQQVWKTSGWDDCCPFYDDDGQLYFIATHFAPDLTNGKEYNVHLFKMTPDGKRLLLNSDTIIHQSQGSEANKLYKINGTYYHYFSEVKNEGRVMMMERAESLYGPWEIRQLNHVNAEQDKEPNQGGLLQLASGKWYFFTHHGTGDWEGRAASLLPVTWLDGWPIVGKVGNDKIGQMVWSALKPVQNKNKLYIHTSDEFASATLAVQWEWNYQPRADKWSLTDHRGFLRLYTCKPIHPEDSSNILLRAANTLTQRSMRTKNNQVTLKMNVENMTEGEYAGLTHFSTTSCSLLGIKQENGMRYLCYNSNGKDTAARIPIKGKCVWLRSVWDYEGKNRYGYSTDGKTFTSFGGIAQLTWGSYRGDRIGIYNLNSKNEEGFVDVDWFHYEYAK